MILASTLHDLGPFPGFPQEVVREELSQPRVPIPAAMTGGPIHRAFIAALPPAWRADPTVEIFSRCLWLKTGWYPLTPHWHFDWGRGGVGPTVETIMACLGDASLTEFVLGPLDHPEAPAEAERPRRGPGGMGRWDAQVAAGLRDGTLRSCRLPPERLVLFDNRSLHRARPATRTGWRLLVRAIRGLGPEADREGGYGRRSTFTTARNGFVPETPEEQARHQAYRD